MMIQSSCSKKGGIAHPFYLTICVNNEILAPLMKVFVTTFGAVLLVCTSLQAMATVKARSSTPSTSEIRGGKVAGADLDTEFERLSTMESKFAESSEQQLRLREATRRRQAPTKKIVAQNSRKPLKVLPLKKKGK
jgi:hypothetical protein